MGGCDAIVGDVVSAVDDGEKLGAAETVLGVLGTAGGEDGLLAVWMLDYRIDLHTMIMEVHT